MTRRIVKIVLALLAVAIAAQYCPLNFLKAPVERALQRGLDRHVEVGEVHIDLFGEPGFTLDDVTIHEDPRAGIEPFAYVSSLDARVRWLSLLRRRLEFTYLNLGDATLNLVKTSDGPWNFQFLLDSAAEGRARVPSIRMRGGRVNFKFGDTQSIFYFSDADLDVAPAATGSAEVRFEGAPSQTDRAAQDFGRFFLNGDWNPTRTPRLNLNVDLERSSLPEIARLIDPRGFGLHGTIALKAQLSGSPSGLDVSGQLQVDDIHRWDLVPKGGGWKLPFKGSLDLHGETLQLASDPAAPVALSLRAWDFLMQTRWEAGLQLNQVPMADLAEVARHMGVPLPDQVTASGAVSGSLSYDEGGLAGHVELADASLTLPGVQPLRTASAALNIGDGAVSLEKSTIEIGERENAELEGSYDFRSRTAVDLRISTRGMSVADMQSFGLAAIPVIDQTHQGSWRGWARYQSPPQATGQGVTQAGGWSGEYDLLNARIPVDGLADPLRVQSASIKLNGTRVAVTKLRAQAGDIGFTGEYRWEPNTLRPHKFKIAVDQADIAELARLFAPTLAREQGFLARTLRFGAATPAPQWLKQRRVDGLISIGSLTAGDVTLSVNQARLLWDAGIVRLAGLDATGLSANLSGAALTGDLQADISASVPHYHFDGQLNHLPYKGGQVDFDGSFDVDGEGLALLDSLHAEGHLRARSIAFSPDADFASASACFELQGIRWKLGSVEVNQGGETYVGTGVSQPDGKLVLDLVRGARSLRLSGPLLASTP